ncbi:hypothetical protein [Hafnia alvei]|uniref:Uncharacterized protein n=1 Tax=Hafnia alvei TaxID=569 RepID=A0ABD7Q963_HAFAL|nr:hypothetical protein [Hafnia alvei]TBL69145.1 hypothetical protein EYY96_05400 [Hafnia alvei]
MSTWLKFTTVLTDDACLAGWETIHVLPNDTYDSRHQIPPICQGLLFIDEVSNEAPLLLTTTFCPLHVIEKFVYACQTKEIDAAVLLYINDDDQGVIYFRRGLDFILCAKNAVQKYNPHNGYPLSILDCLNEAILKGMTYDLMRLSSDIQ